MDDYAGRVLADRYRLPLPPSDEYELTESRAFDTYSGQEVLVRQVMLPEVVEAEVLDAEGLPDGFTARDPRGGAGRGQPARSSTRRPADPAVRRAVDAAQAAARIPDHPRLDQVFDVFAEGGSLWIVSELVSARSLASLLVEKPLTPYRAAEVASDVLMALRVLHAHGWVHRNITARTVLVCDDGRVMLTGLAVGAAEEALCGYDPVPAEDGDGGAPGAPGGPGPDGATGGFGPPAPRPGPGAADPEAARRAAIEARVSGELSRSAPGAGAPGGAPDTGGDIRAARAGAIAAYRAGARAAARVQEARDTGRAALPGARTAPDATPGSQADGAHQQPYLPGGEANGVSQQPYLPGGEANGVSQQAYLPGGEANGVSQQAYLPGGEANGVSQQAYLPGGEANGVSQQPYLSGGEANGVSQQAYLPGGEANGVSQQVYLPGGDANGVSQQAYLPGTQANGVSQQPYLPGGEANGASQQPYGSGVRAHDASEEPRLPGGPSRSGGSGGPGGPPGRIADPYGVRATPWHGAGPRGGAPLPAPAEPDRARAALPPGFRPADDGIGAPGAHGPAPRGLPAPGTEGSGIPGIQALGPVIPDPTVPAPPVPVPPAPGVLTPRPARWDDLVAGTPSLRGPTTALAAERARQARMAVVGPVTERWAPEQAGPVHENWQLAAPIGPATDLWALGALLFRAVQGHAPYPEESTAELVQMVCAEPPAFAEECGALRPVVESLLRQDPTERPDVEELSGWLRSLVRSAPEPEAGTHVVAAPPADPRRLPIVRRRGELVRRRRAGLPAHHGRHKRAKKETGSPRRLGRTLLLLVLLGMAAAIAYAMLFMPKAGGGSGATADPGRTGAAGQASPEGSAGSGGEPRPDQTSPDSGNSPSESAGSTEPQGDGPEVPDGFTLRKDDAGFQVAVANGWERTPKNGRGQVVYSQGGFDLIVVPGRDTAASYGDDPMVYQREHERELQPYRDSSWASSSGLKSIQVGERTMAEGQFTWTDGQGRELFVRNLAILVDGRYHVVQLRGPEAERDEVTRLFEQASATYQVTG